MLALLAQPRAVLGDVVGGQLDVGEDRVGAHVRLEDHAVRTEALHLAPGQERPRPGPRGHDHVRHAAYHPRGAVVLPVLVLDRLEAVCLAGRGGDIGHLRLCPDVYACGLGELGDGFGEM